MSSSAVSTITKAATRKGDDSPLNILTFPTHERYETNLSFTNHNFYSVTSTQLKKWNEEYAAIPDNYHIIDSQNESIKIPLHLDFDLVLSQSKYGQYDLASKVSRMLHLPLVTLEHTLPTMELTPDVLNMRGHRNVFISDYSRKEWKWETKHEDTTVIRHGVDTKLFCPSASDKQNHVLSVVNDYINRDYCCGFHLWQIAIDNLPTKLFGNTPGLSVPAVDVHELVRGYQDSKVFLNTSTLSPIPMTVLEAMSCGCAVVSTNNCMIPEIIEHGVNGFLTNDPHEMKRYLTMLLDSTNTDLRVKMGKAARETIVEKFSLGKFIQDWNAVFWFVASCVYKGVPNES